MTTNQINEQVLQKVFGYRFEPAEEWIQGVSQVKKAHLRDRWVPPKGFYGEIFDAYSAKDHSGTVFGPIPDYANKMQYAWLLVANIQRLQLGWRFSIIGGDQPFPTVFSEKLEPSTGKERSAVWWHAEFFGHENPKLCTGQRHGSQYASTPSMAICLAAIEAMEKYK